MYCILSFYTARWRKWRDKRQEAAVGLLLWRQQVWSGCAGLIFRKGQYIFQQLGFILPLPSDSSKKKHVYCILYFYICILSRSSCDTQISELRCCDPTQFEMSRKSRTSCTSARPSQHVDEKDLRRRTCRKHKVPVVLVSPRPHLPTGITEVEVEWATTCPQLGPARNYLKVVTTSEETWIIS